MLSLSCSSGRAEAVGAKSNRKHAEIPPHYWKLARDTAMNNDAEVYLDLFDAPMKWCKLLIQANYSKFTQTQEFGEISARIAAAE